MISVPCHLCGTALERLKPITNACCKECNRLRKIEFNRKQRDQNRQLRQQLRPGDNLGRKREVQT